jgi:5-methylthioadenosine/S-adenosylhomocysteine deaminase
MVFDILIKGGFLITMDSGNRVLTNGYVGVTGDTIIKVGSLEEFKGDKANTVIDAVDKIIMPGLIDTHGHAGHGLTKTMGESLFGKDWLRLMEYIYFENTTEEFWYAEGLLSGIERLKAGTTCGYSMLGSAPRSDELIYTDMNAEALKKVGIRGIIGMGPCRPPWPRRFIKWKDEKPEELTVTFEQTLNTTRAALKKWHGKNDSIFVHVSPSEIGSIMANSVEAAKTMFLQLKNIATEYGTMLNSHLYGGGAKFAYQYLDVLGPNTIVAHATGISTEEVKILGDTGTNVSTAPSARSFCRNRCPVPELMDAGANVVISTDGTSPDRTFDLFKELKVAMIEHRSHFSDSSYLPPGRVLKMVTIDAAKAMNLDSMIGSLECGKKADIILIDMNSPHLVPKLMPVQRVAYEVTGSDVSTVIVNGKILMENRKVLTVNEKNIIDMAQSEAEKMLKRADIYEVLNETEGFWDGTRYKFSRFDKNLDIVTPD